MVYLVIWSIWSVWSIWSIWSFGLFGRRKREMRERWSVWSIWSFGLFGHLVNKNRRSAMGDGQKTQSKKRECEKSKEFRMSGEFADAFSKSDRF